MVLILFCVVRVRECILNVIWDSLNGSPSARTYPEKCEKKCRQKICTFKSTSFFITICPVHILAQIALHMVINCDSNWCMIDTKRNTIHTATHTHHAHMPFTRFLFTFAFILHQHHLLLHLFLLRLVTSIMPSHYMIWYFGMCEWCDVMRCVVMWYVVTCTAYIYCYHHCNNIWMIIFSFFPPVFDEIYCTFQLCMHDTQRQ